MALTTFPDDFALMLTERGRQLLAGEGDAVGALAREPFFSAGDLLDPARVRAAAGILARAFGDQLVEMEKPVPPALVSSVVSGGERLPKVGRMLTTPMDGDAETMMEREVVRRAAACGLLAMVRSPAYHRFVEALVGRPVVGPDSVQVLCYRPGDYAGPHTDHHPEHPAQAAGYVDVHLTFCTPGVKEQLLVSERGGHLCEVRSLAKSGTVTAYRLPFWHYTTPLQAKPGHEATARRWLVLGGFTDAR